MRCLPALAGIPSIHRRYPGNKKLFAALGGIADGVMHLPRLTRGRNEPHVRLAVGP